MADCGADFGGADCGADFGSADCGADSGTIYNNVPAMVYYTTEQRERMDKLNKEKIERRRLKRQKKKEKRAETTAVTTQKLGSATKKKEKLNLQTKLLLLKLHVMK
ncbi:hypothetical protein CFE70_000789 [Pyrenophora teres f. teres 0-1]|nr:hypothetical protein P3342_000974 [Pyrenophora teres f. teres]